MKNCVPSIKNPMKAAIPLILTFAVLSAPLASAALVVTNGDFETNPPTSGGYTGTATGWFTTGGTGGQIVAIFPGSFTGTSNTGSAKGAMESTGGYFYQSLGTYSGESSLQIQLDLFQQKARECGNLRFSIFAGTPNTAAANGVDIFASKVAAAGLTQLGSTITIADQFPGAVGTAYQSLNYNAGTIDLSGATVGQSIWLYIDSTTANASGGTEPWFDNVQVLTTVPEPGAWMSLLGGCGVLMGLRRRRY
jgi:hypothetical protein